MPTFESRRHLFKKSIAEQHDELRAIKFAELKADHQRRSATYPANDDGPDDNPPPAPAPAPPPPK